MENHAFLNNTLHPALGVLTGTLIKSQFTQLCLTILGICAMYLKNLINLGIVQKERPYGEKASRKSIYSIEDNMFRFWYRFVFENNSIIARGVMDVVYMKNDLWHIIDYKTNAAPVTLPMNM